MADTTFGLLMEPETKQLIIDTRNQLIDKIVRTLVLQTHEIADVVSLYYDTQNLRIAHANKKRTEAPSELVQWLDRSLTFGETVIHNKLDQWILSDQAPAEAQWAYDQIGIGPIIAAGLASHIDIEKAQSVVDFAPVVFRSGVEVISRFASRRSSALLRP